MVVIEAFLSLLLGSVFIASAIPKLRHPKGFVLTVLEYRVLPTRLSRLYGWLLPPLELLIALLFFSGTAIRLAGLLSALLLLSFIIAVSMNMVRGRDLDCGCFGKARKRKIGGGLLLQDALLLAASLTTVFIPQTWVGLESWSLFHLAGMANALIPVLCLMCAVAAIAVISRTGWWAAFSFGKRSLQLHR